MPEPFVSKPGIIRTSVSYWTGKPADEVEFWDGVKVFGLAAAAPAGLAALASNPLTATAGTSALILLDCIPEKQSQDVQDDDSENPALPEEGIVGSIVDGDTFILEGGKTIDLIGVNAPDEGESCFAEAKDDLVKLLSGKRVTMLPDPLSSGEDDGRYVYLQDDDETFVNEYMLQHGNVRFDRSEEDRIAFYDKLLDAEEDAREASRGCLWRGTETVVKNVLNGGTFVLNDDHEISLIGVVAQNEDDECFEEGKSDLEHLLSDAEGNFRSVVLRQDPYADGGDGRYVYLLDEDDTFVNERMLQLGSVRFDSHEGDLITHYDKLKDAQEDAQKASRGCLWGGCVLVSLPHGANPIVDGDTFKFGYGITAADPILLMDRFTVRMLGINTPETDSDNDVVASLGDAATDELRAMIEGKMVRLSSDDEADNMDSFGRLLRYVNMCDETAEDVNHEMIRMGLACPYMISGLVRRYAYTEALNEAMRDGNGFWGGEADVECCDTSDSGICVVGAGGDDDTAGDDDIEPPTVGEDLTCTVPTDESTCLCVAAIEASGEEYIALGNTCGVPFSLDGWSVDDGYTTYNFTPTDGTTPAPVLEPCAGSALCEEQGSTLQAECIDSTEPPLTLYTGDIPGDHVEADGPAISWHRGTGVWNNTGGDTASLDGPDPGTAQDFSCSYE